MSNTRDTERMIEEFTRLSGDGCTRAEIADCLGMTPTALDTVLHRAGVHPGPDTTRRRTDSTEQDWRHRAACHTAEPDLFFPLDENNAGPAVQVCRTCPVITDCREFAITTGQDHGIWGGLTSQQRRELRRYLL